MEWLSYALGSDQTRKLKDFMLDIRDAVNKDMSLNLGAIPYLPDQAMHLKADIANLKHDTGWHSCVTDGYPCGQKNRRKLLKYEILHRGLWSL